MAKAMKKSGSTNLESISKPSYIPDVVENPDSVAVDANDLIIPRLEIVQPLSPVKDENDGKYIEGAKDGMLYNTVTRELYPPQGVRVIPVLFRKEWLVFVDRDAGGGFRGAFLDPDEAKNRVSEIDESSQVIDAAVHFCLAGGPEDRKEQIAIVCTKTKMKISRQWNSIVKMSGLDRYARAYLIGSTMEENKKGKYYNFTVRTLGWPNEEEFTVASELYNNLKDMKPTTIYEDENVEKLHDKEM